MSNPKGNTSTRFKANQSIDINKLTVLIESIISMNLDSFKSISERSGISPRQLKLIINKEHFITNKMAGRLVSYFGTQILK